MPVRLSGFSLSLLAPARGHQQESRNVHQEDGAPGKASLLLRKGRPVALDLPLS